MTKAKYKQLLDKSISAALAAIELYNKPVFKYREESFTILIINAWELLLKAKLLKDSNNKLTALYVQIPRKKRDGSNAKSFQYKTNRSGTFMTIGIQKLIEIIITNSNIKNNLELLVEIRDNNIHFINNAKLFEKYFLEIALANLKNYSALLKKWFDISLQEIDLFLIPLAFNIPKTFKIESLNRENNEHKKLLAYIAKQKQQVIDDEEYRVSIVVDVKLEKQSQGDFSVKYDKEGIPVFIDSEEQFKKKYPLNYETLINKLKNRYTDFKQNEKFNNIKRELCKNEKYHKRRFLDYESQKGSSKPYYSTEILKEFDKYYTKK